MSETAKDDPIKPSCIARWEGPGSAEITVEIDGCTPAQLWAAARLIERFADDLYTQSQIDAQRRQVTDQIEAQAVAQKLMGGAGKIIPVHGHIKRGDA
jgi:hypothetical protein